ALPRRGVGVGCATWCAGRLVPLLLLRPHRRCGTARALAPVVRRVRARGAPPGVSWPGVSVLDAGPFACHPGAAFAGDSRPGVLTDHRAHGHGGHRSTARQPPTRTTSATGEELVRMKFRARVDRGPRRSTT